MFVFAKSFKFSLPERPYFPNNIPGLLLTKPFVHQYSVLQPKKMTVVYDPITILSLIFIPI